MTNYLQFFWFCIQILQLCSTAGVKSCKVKELSSSSTYVTASFEQPTPVTGCTSHELSRNLQSVYVIGLADWNITGNQIPIIDLHLQTINSQHDSQKQIFVLASEQPVTWRLHTDAKNRVVKGKFVISNQSQLAHSLRVKHKPENVAIPFRGDVLRLENWVRRKWGAVTTLAYLQQPSNWIMLPLVSVPKSNVTCRIQPNYANIHASNVEEQVIHGCVERVKEKNHERDVHIIELLSATIYLQGHPIPVVELNIKSEVRKHLVIILKCHHPVKWKIFTSRLKGSIDIIADQSIDSSGIKARHFHVAAERLHTLAGQDLIAWSAEKYGPITSYSSAAVANRIKLTIDSEVRVLYNETAYSTVSAPVEVAVLGADDGHNSVTDEKKRLKRLIIRALSLSCKENSMRISIWKHPFRNLPLSFDKISFLDLSCQAVDDGAHLVLSTRYSECGTRHPVTRDGTSIFTNAVVVRPQISALSVFHDLRPKSLSDMKMPVVINVSCQYLQPQNNEHAIHLSTVQFEMNVYKDKDYRNQVVEFPMILHPSEELFVEIEAFGYDNLNVVLRNCSLDSERSHDGLHLSEHWLIVNGCAADETWKWTNNGSQSFSRRERFAFGFSDSLGVNSIVNLRCSIAVCTHHPDHSIAGLTVCSSLSQRCDVENHFDQSQIVTNLVKGPFLLLPTEDVEPDVAALDLPVTKETFLPAAIHQDADQPIGVDKVHSASCTGMVLVDGVTAGAVIGISFTAFFIGVLLMSSLWYIHVHTGPRKKIGLKASDSKNIRSKIFCSDSGA